MYGILKNYVVENEFVFFEVDADCHITLNLENDVEEGIYFGTDKIADNLADFVSRMSEDSNYYDDIRWDMFGFVKQKNIKLRIAGNNV